MIDYTTYHAEDLLLDPGFIRACKEPTSPEGVFWNSYISQHPSFAHVIAEARELYRMMSVSVDPQERQLAMARIEDYIKTNSQTQSPTGKVRRLSSAKWLRYAAAAAILIGVVSVFMFVRRGAVAEGAVTVARFTESNFSVFLQTTSEERKNVQLPDGSTVLLNYGSKLEIGENFNTGKRWLRLTGEAFFAVKKDIEKPFVVLTAQTATTALGTSFKVRAYPGEEQANVMLATGKVEVLNIVNSNNREAVTLLPGQQADWSPRQQLKQVTFNADDLENWKQGNIVFDKADIREIAATLEFQYGTRIRFQNKPGEPIAFTGKFYGKTLKEVLEAIAFTNRFVYMVNGNAVTITFR